MKKILFLDSAVISKPYSFLTAVMDEFQKVAGNVERINLNDTEFAKNSLNGNTFPQYWSLVKSDEWIEKLKQTDLLVISSSLINFTAPAILKNFFDGIAVADKTFSYKLSKDGNPVGLLNNLNVVVVTSQGGPQPEGTESIQKQWLRTVLNFVGAKSINFIEINGTKMPNLANVNPEDYAKTRVAEFEQILKNI
ncbi:FMN-dependent NADH-azoreductase [Mycoplasmopsis maculosa]|uniref:FMN-dependent NADH-azoreductase n=1 Tax=Mycoplasmopsis maculosa TaxID=114885 RepID=A0A449B3L4_9BACT|nr:FMN-dependent NADH-azoreductase [Mycoplasmopsis maculosa]VEU75176.1 FMN-dependent NADH-azoreductase [Mycoplasmopsis maculosa]